LDSYRAAASLSTVVLTLPGRLDTWGEGHHQPGGVGWLCLAQFPDGSLLRNVNRG